MGNVLKVRRLIQPRSLAIVGATENPGPGAEAMKNALRAPALREKVFPVNPSRKEIFGVPCYSSLRELPAGIEAVVVATPTRAVVGVLQEAAALGIHAAIILASGFAEAAYEEGKRSQREILELARQADMAVCGPNCLGTADLVSGSFATVLSVPDYSIGRHERSVAVISQSGGLLISFVNRAAARRLPLRCLVSSGNEAVTQLEDYIEFFLEDSAIRVIACICEGIADGRRLLSLARRASQLGKRIAVLKLGCSTAGQKAVLAHTGRLAGSDVLVSTALAEGGIARCDRVDELVEFCQLACRYPKFCGTRTAALMVSGGIAALASDSAERHGLLLPSFSPDTAAEIRKLVPAYATVSNPLDLTGGTMLHDLKAIRRAVELVAADPGNDLLLFLFPLQSDGGPSFTRNLVRYIAGLSDEVTKPLMIVSPNSGSVTDYWAEISTQVAGPFLEDAETAFKVIRCWGRMGVFHEPIQGETKVPVSEPFISLPPGKTVLSEAECYRLLEPWQIPVARYHVCGTVEEAIKAAGEIGFPVALKIVSPDFPHKSDQGLVALRVRDEQALRAKFSEIINKAYGVMPGGEIQGVLVQSWIDQGLEFLVGCQLDPQFGEAILIALGGVFTEVFQDSTLILAPASADHIRERLTDLRSYALLEGVRGTRPYDIEAFCRLIERLSYFIPTLAGRLETFELNPVKVLHQGEGVVVVDALGILRADAELRDKGVI